MQSSVVVFYSHKHVSFFSWVQVACPRLSIDWGYAFPKPLLSPYEVRNLLFYPIKIRLLRTSCCQILAIYSIVKGDYPPRFRSLALSYLSTRRCSAGKSGTDPGNEVGWPRGHFDVNLCSS